MEQQKRICPQCSRKFSKLNYVEYKYVFSGLIENVIGNQVKRTEEVYAKPNKN